MPTSLAPSAPLTREELDAICREVYATDRWAAPLAADISHAIRRPVRPAQVNQWQSGARPVPAWVRDTLPVTFLKRFHVMGDEALRAKKVAERLIAAAFPINEAELEPDADNASDPTPGM